MQALEEAQVRQYSYFMTMQLHLEDMEGRGRRNNLRLKGIPEAAEEENVTAVAQSVLQQLSQSYTAILLDRAHRMPGPKPGHQGRPRNVLYRLHYVAEKKTLARKAWNKGPLRFGDSDVSVFPDLSRLTLQRRAILKPLRGAIRAQGGTYKWG